MDEMKRLDLLVYVVLFFLGIGIGWFSLQLDYGEMARPGSGFLSFWCGVFIAIISLGLVLQQFWKKNVSREDVFHGIDPLKPLTILGAMVLYGLFFEKIGFILANIVFLVLIFRLVWKKGWGFILSASILIDLAFYIILQVLMKVELPKGILANILKFL